MEGQVTRLADISDFRKVDELYAGGAASLFSTLLVILSARLGGSEPLNALFDQFGLESVVGLTALLTILLQVARYLYWFVYGSSGKPWSPVIFLCIAVAVQMLHDGLFNYGILSVVPKGKNDLLDALRRHVYEAKLPGMVASAALMGLTALAAMVLYTLGDVEQIVFTFVVAYGIVYALSGVVKKPAPPPAVVPKKEESFRDSRGFY